MVSRENKRATLCEKLQLLRSVTNSDAVPQTPGSINDLLLIMFKLNNTSIIIDASKYIKELKQKVERLNQDIAAAQNSNDKNTLPTVTVETLEKGFLVDVFSEKSCPGLLVFILEAFEELDLNVLEARVSCTDSFRLEAVGGENQGQVENMSAHVVKQAMLQAIRNWSESSEH